MITHLFFDYGDLLGQCSVSEQTLRRAHRKAAQYLRAHGHPVTARQLEEARTPVLREYFAARRKHYEWPLERILEGTLRALDIPAGQRRLHDLARLYERFDHDERLFPDVVEVIPRLAERRTLGIISNCPHSSSEATLAAHGLLKHFPHRVYSHETEVRKPLQSIYDFALLCAGVDDPRTTVYVSHEERDLLGAHGAGMRTALIRRDKGETLHKLLRYA